MRIKNIEIVEDLESILHEIQSEIRLNGSELLRAIRPTGSENVMVSCIYHNNGMERKPSAGIRRSDGEYHCFACDEVHDFPEFVSNCFGRNDGGAFGWNWLLKHYVTISAEDREKVELDFGRERRMEARAKKERLSRIRKSKPIAMENSGYVSEEELDSYRYWHPYWEERGIVDDYIIELFDLGYDPSDHCITFPVLNDEGYCVFVARRNVHTKFFNYPRDVAKPLYGLFQIFGIERETGRFPDGVFITESMIDCLLLWQAGFYAVAMNGLGSEAQLQRLKELPCRHLILATDNDEKGMEARQKIKRKVDNKLFSEILFPARIKDVGECTAEQIKNIKKWEEYV